MTSHISTQAVQKVAGLARLHTQSEEGFLIKFQKELDTILSYVDELEKAEIKVGQITKRTTPVNSLRQDVPRDDQEKSVRTRNNILNNFPSSQGELLILPGIFHDN